MPRGRAWTLAYRRWLTTVRFDHPAQQIVLQDYIHAVEDAECGRDRLTRQIEELLPTWSMAPVVAALQAMRGVALIVAVTVVAEVGDFRRFANPRQLMAYLGLVPSEHSSGSTVRRGGITKAGNALARRVLIEGAWTYRMQARVSRKLHDRLEPLPRRSATSPGKRSSGCARDIGVWPPPASPRSWSPPRSPARWSASSGRSPALAASSPNRPPKLNHERRPANIRCAHGGRQGNGGEPSCAVMSRLRTDARPLERGSPETQPRSCGTQPAHESLFNRRLQVLSPALRTNDRLQSAAAE